MAPRKKASRKKKSSAIVLSRWQHYFRRAIIFGAVSVILTSVHHAFGVHVAIVGGGLVSALMSDIEDGLLG